ncbi:MAG: DUF885 domain-containing protein [Bacteroides sp.]|nr:DUF885 domain-containing protein [Bacteroides sp.]MCM1550620.1 DUF885 domain-containing protein [Clostridium sp.]
MRLQTLSKKITAIAMSVLLLFSVSGCNNSSGVAASPDADFDAFLEELFLEEVTSDTLSLHFTLKDPEGYGIEDMEPTLGDLTDRDFTNSAEDWADVEATFQKLKSFRYSDLDEKQQLTYDILYHYIEQELSMKDCNYQGTIFGQVSGVQSNMPLNMSLYEFYSGDDVEDYLALMEQLDDYFDYCIAYEQFRTDEGYGMSDGAIDDAIEQCEEFLTHTDDNYLITTFDHRVDALEGLSDTERASYKDQNRNTVLNTIIPAYESMIDELNALKGKGEDRGGICNYEDGKEYYEYIVSHKTGSSKTIEEMKAVLEQVLDDAIEMSYDVYLNAPDVYMEYYGDENFVVEGMSEPESFLEYYKQEMAQEFPTPPEVNYTISDIDPAIADIVSPAFCVTPCLDDYTENVIQVNRSKDNGGSGGLSAMYAHEGYPGHLYQLTYFLSTDPYPVRDTLSFLGYDEGWAMYVEMRSYNWVTYEDYDSQYVREMYVAGELMNIAFCCLADINVNYYGYTLEELSTYMDDLGFNGSAAQGLYDMMVEEPGYYPQYFVGYLEFAELRNYAKNALGADFDEVAYHQVILETGPCDFDTLRTQMDKYIATVVD